MESGDITAQGVPIVLPAGQPDAQTFAVDFSLATILQGPASGTAGGLIPGVRLYAKATPTGVTLKSRNIVVQVLRIDGALAASVVNAGRAPGAVVRDRRR